MGGVVVLLTDGDDTSIHPHEHDHALASRKDPYLYMDARYCPWESELGAAQESLEWTRRLARAKHVMAGVRTLKIGLSPRHRSLVDRQRLAGCVSGQSLFWLLDSDRMPALTSLDLAKTIRASVVHVVALPRQLKVRAC